MNFENAWRVITQYLDSLAGKNRPVAAAGYIDAGPTAPPATTTPDTPPATGKVVVPVFSGPAILPSFTTQIALTAKPDPAVPPPRDDAPLMPMSITLRGEMRYHAHWKKKTVSCGFTNALQTWNDGYHKYSTGAYAVRAPDELEPGIHIYANGRQGVGLHGAWSGAGRLGSLRLEKTGIIKGAGKKPVLDEFSFNCSPKAKNALYIRARIERGDNDQLDNHHQEGRLTKRLFWKPRFWFEVNGKKVGLGETFRNPRGNKFEILAVLYWGRPSGWHDVEVLGKVLAWFEEIPVVGWLEEKLNDFGNWLESLW